MTPIRFAVTFKEWQDSLRVESVITKSTHFVALLEYPRNSPHRAAWVSFFKPPLFSFCRSRHLVGCLCSMCREAVTAERADLLQHRCLIPVDVLVRELAVAKAYDGDQRDLDVRVNGRDSGQNPRALWLWVSLRTVSSLP